MPTSAAFRESIRHVGRVTSFTLTSTIEEEDRDTPDSTSPSYDEQKPDVELMRTVVGGTRAIRKKKEQFLTRHPGEDKEDYERRLKKSVLYNATGQAIEALTGMVMRKDPVLSDVSPAFEEHTGNIDLTGRDLPTFTRDVFKSGLTDGHSWIHVEFPRIDGDSVRTRRQFRESGARPYWIDVPKLDAINWRYEIREGAPFLTLFVYRERTEEAVGNFGAEITDRYRVLRPGSWELWEKQKGSDGKTRWVRVDQGENALPVIPVVFVPSNRTGLFRSSPPLLDMADENIGHYDVRSNHRYALSFASVPIPYFIDVEFERDEHTGEIKWGPGRSLHLTSTGETTGEIGILESQGVALGESRQELADIEGRMARLGLQMIVGQPNPQPRTATEHILDKSDSEAALANAARALQNALGECKLLHEAYMAVDADGNLPRNFEAPGTIEVNTDFHRQLISAQHLTALSKTVAAGQLPLEALWDIMVAGELLPEDFDSERARTQLAAELDREMRALGGVSLEAA